MRKSVSDITWFVRQIAEGDSALDMDAINRLSSQIGFSSGSSGAFCVAFKYTDSDLLTEDVLMVQELYKACIAAIKSLNIEAYCYIGNRLFTVIVFPDTSLHNAQMMERIHRTVSKYCKNAVQMGVGSVCDSLEKLNYSRVEAYEALNSISRSNRISYIDDIYVTRNITTYKYQREKRIVLEQFKRADIEQLKTSTMQLVENVRKGSPVRSGSPYPTSIRRTIVELLFEIMHISSDAGVDVDALLDYQDPYSKVFEMDETPLILAWFFDVVERLSKSMLERQDNTENNNMVLAGKTIMENLSNPELSLSLLSDALEITPSYFSALFIRETGVGFNEYITDLRMEKAKQLLQESNIRVALIAERCGFRSASYFIAVFRKHTGMAPGQYRKLKDHSKEQNI